MNNQNENSEEEIGLTKLEFKNKNCDCCARNFNSNEGRILISGHFVCDECQEKCEPLNKECSITGNTREFK